MVAVSHQCVRGMQWGGIVQGHHFMTRHHDMIENIGDSDVKPCHAERIQMPCHTEWIQMPCRTEWIKMPRSVLIFSQSDNLIQVVDINSHNEWQTVQIQISWLP